MMHILISITSGDGLLEGIDVEDMVRFALSKLDLPSNTEVSVTFVDDDEMAELNGRYRGLDRPTDVLSFECDNLEDEFSDLEYGGEEDVYSLGDIVIAPDVAKAQSEMYGNTFEQEILLLLVHGILHLCGFDHIKDDEAEIMESKQREIVAAYNTYKCDR